MPLRNCILVRIAIRLEVKATSYILPNRLWRFCMGPRFGPSINGITAGLACGGGSLHAHAIDSRRGWQWIGGAGIFDN